MTQHNDSKQEFEAIFRPELRRVHYYCGAYLPDRNLEGEDYDEALDAAGVMNDLWTGWQAAKASEDGGDSTAWKQIACEMHDALVGAKNAGAVDHQRLDKAIDLYDAQQDKEGRGFPPAPAPVVPDGWKLVPEEPTDVMLNAGVTMHLPQTMSPARLALLYDAMIAAAPQPEQKEEPQGTEKYRYCNHHHELTDDHCLVDFGDGEFVANREAVPLLRALNEIGIRTRTHHVGDSHGFVGILMDNVQIEVREIHERDADRDRYNGKMELLVSWDRKSQQEQEDGHEHS